MDLIRTDRYGNEIAFMQNVDCDFEISSAGDGSALNDFVIDINRADWSQDITEGCRVYAPGTEYGGIIGEFDTSTAENRISVKGYTWRGMMDHKIIRPAAGAEANKNREEIAQEVDFIANQIQNQNQNQNQN